MFTSFLSRRTLLIALAGAVVVVAGMLVGGLLGDDGGHQRIADDPPLPADVSYLAAELTSGDRGRVQAAGAVAASGRQLAVLTARYAGLRAAGLEVQVLEMAPATPAEAHVRLGVFDRHAGRRIAASEAGLRVVLDGDTPRFNRYPVFVLDDT